MNRKTILRILLATELILGITIIVVSSYADSELAPSSDAWTKQDTIDLIVGFPLFVFVLVTFYGMYVFWKRAPLLYLIIALTGLIYDVILGQGTTSSWEQIHDNVGMAFHAVILGLVYFSPLKELYVRDKSALKPPLMSYFQRWKASQKLGLASLFEKIETADDALKTIKDASKALYLMGAILLLASIVLDYAYVYDAGLFVVIAFCLHRWNSRVAAMSLLLLGPVVLMKTRANLFGGSEVGGKNLFLAIVIILISIRAVIATFTLPRLLGSHSETKFSAH